MATVTDRRRASRVGNQRSGGIFAQITDPAYREEVFYPALLDLGYDLAPGTGEIRSGLRADAAFGKAGQQIEQGQYLPAAGSLAEGTAEWLGAIPALGVVASLPGDLMRFGKRIMPKPEKFSKVRGGQYQDMTGIENMMESGPEMEFGTVVPSANIDVTQKDPLNTMRVEEGILDASPVAATKANKEEFGPQTWRTNLFRQVKNRKRKDGSSYQTRLWSWVDKPEGVIDNAPVVSLHKGSDHVYVLDATYDNPAELARSPQAKLAMERGTKIEEPSMMPTTRGSLYLGKKVGTIKTPQGIRDVYDQAAIAKPGQENFKGLTPAPKDFFQKKKTKPPSTDTGLIGDDILEMGQDFKDLPVIKMSDYVGKKIRPTEADLTVAGKQYTGQYSTDVDPEDLLGGPLYPLLKSSEKSGSIWAGDAEGIGEKYLSSDADYMAVTAMSDVAHQSNTSIANAIFKQVEADLADGRITPEGLNELNAMIVKGGVQEKKIFNQANLDKAESLMANGMSAKEAAAEIGATSKRAKDELNMMLNLRKFPGFGSPDLPAFLRNATFDTRAKIVSTLNSVAAENLGAPNINRILRQTLQPEFAGMDHRSGLLMVEIDKNRGLMDLRNDPNAVEHPSYQYGLPGKVVGRFPGPVQAEELFPNFFQRLADEGKDPAFMPITFRRELPVQEITPEIAQRIDVPPLQTIQSQRQARLAMDVAERNWMTTDAKVTEGGVSPSAFSKAIRESDASPSLTPYTEKEIKKGVKDGTFKVYQLGNSTTDAQIFFGLKKNYSFKEAYGFEHPELNGTETALVGVVNNELGAKGVGGSSIVLKAIEEGAQVLDAFAVKTAKHPGGFLPKLYNKFGFEELGRVPFDTSEYTPQKLADLKAYWKSTGWDESQGLPDVVIMKWRGDDAARSTATDTFIREGSLSARRQTPGAGTAAAQINRRGSGRSADGAQQPSQRGDSSGDRGSVRDDNGGRLPSGLRGILSEAASLTPQQAEVFGLDPNRIQNLRTSFPGLL
jgi:hypothetical protein